jgi:hypothetical protein
MSSKRQQTFAKMERERRVKEKRALKQEKKAAAAAEKNAPPVDPSMIVYDEAGYPIEQGEVSESPNGESAEISERSESS